MLASADAIDELVLLRNNTSVTSVLQSTPDNPLHLLGVVEGLSVGENTISTNIGNNITVAPPREARRLLGHTSNLGNTNRAQPTRIATNGFISRPIHR